MRRGMLIGLGLSALCAFASIAVAGSEEDGRVLCPEEIRAAMEKNYRLAQYIERNGMPDVAASQQLSDQRPWSERQVTLYYLETRKEISFARAYILGTPSVAVERYERPLTSSDVSTLRGYKDRIRCKRPPRREEITVFAPRSSSPSGDGPAERAERAANRAEAAVRRIEAAAVRTEAAANRTEQILETVMRLHR